MTVSPRSCDSDRCALSAQDDGAATGGRRAGCDMQRHRGRRRVVGGAAHPWRGGGDIRLATTRLTKFPRRPRGDRRPRPQPAHRRALGGRGRAWRQHLRSHPGGSRRGWERALDGRGPASGCVRARRFPGRVGARRVDQARYDGAGRRGCRRASSSRPGGGGQERGIARFQRECARHRLPEDGLDGPRRGVAAGHRGGARQHCRRAQQHCRPGRGGPLARRPGREREPAPGSRDRQGRGARGQRQAVRQVGCWQEHVRQGSLRQGHPGEVRR